MREVLIVKISEFIESNGYITNAMARENFGFGSTKVKNLFNKLDKFICSINDNDDKLMSTLHYAQNIFGYLPKEVQIYIGEKLSIPLNKIESTISFYSYFSTELKGKYKINVCLGSACSKNNSNEIMNEFERLIGIKSGQTTSDMKFSLDYSRCVGVCRKPPIITVNGRVYESVTPEDIPSILKNYK